jgi:D-alanyl-D-alanine carboxypeptidase/D-alanyl-D-alanine-endopeptidase (penicillin-binding protein 4)
MYIFFLFFISITLCATNTVKQLTHHIDAIIAQHPEMHIGCKIISLKNNKVIYSHNAQQLFTPASNTKVFTALFALEHLGPDFVFSTDVYSDGNIRNNTLHGNLYLKTSGNPSFTTKNLEKLISYLRQIGIKKITGNFYIDTTAFDAEWYPPGSMMDNIGYAWNTPICSFIVDHKPCIFPDTHFNKKNKPSEEFMYANTIINALLKKHHINFKGSISSKEVPPTAQKILQHTSPPLSQLLTKMLKESDNLYADCFFKQVSYHINNSSGTWKKSHSILKEFLMETLDISPQEISILDGSGRCRYNLISPQHVVKLLQWGYQQPYFPEFFDSLPINGVDGSLKNRASAFPGCVHAKTGTLNGVSALSGYIDVSQDTLAFCIFINGFTTDNIANPACKRNIEDAICEKIAELI